MSQQVYVVNREDAQREVDIVNTETGSKSSVFVQPLAKLKLEAGFVVQPAFLRLNKKITQASPPVVVPVTQKEAEKSVVEPVKVETPDAS